jgi:hypothetical protein
MFKAACLQIHANIHENLEKCIYVKFYEVNIGRNLNIVNSTKNPWKLPNRGQKYAKNSP